MSLTQSIRRDIKAALDRDPAAESVLEVVLTYSGFHARQLHRLFLGRPEITTPTTMDLSRYPAWPNLTLYGTTWMVTVHPAFPRITPFSQMPEKAWVAPTMVVAGATS